VLAGSWIGTHFLVGARTRSLRLVFAAVIALLAVEMLYSSATGKF
jgi:uncharacterized membrane protein YfcA